MKEYFTGHRDAVRINEFLNAHSEDSRDFQIVYRLRKMGERFVDGSLTLQDVEMHYIAAELHCPWQNKHLPRFFCQA